MLKISNEKQFDTALALLNYYARGLRSGSLDAYLVHQYAASVLDEMYLYAISRPIYTERATEE